MGFRVEFEQSGMGLGSVGACGWGLLMVSYVESNFLMLSGFSVVNILMMGFVNDGICRLWTLLTVKYANDAICK